MLVDTQVFTSVYIVYAKRMKYLRGHFTHCGTWISKFYCTVLTFVHLAALLTPVTIAVPGYPVILVPGDGGSQLEAKLNKSSVVHYVCHKTTDTYFDLWLNLELLVPVVLDCWVDNMRLEYNNVTRKTTNSPGVDIRIPGFGNTSTVEWLDPSQLSLTEYFKAVVSTLLTQKYERGISVRGAPYDFRKAPNELEDFYTNFKALVEDTYAQNSQQRVVLVAHSMGAPVILYFLNRQPTAWKDKYVRALVTLAGAWGGALKAMRVFASGDNLGVVVLSSNKLRDEQRTSPSLAFLLPSDRFWKSDEVLISTALRNYTVNDYQAFFHDINYTTGYDMWKDTKDLIYSFDPPEVEVHCLHGMNVTTDEQVLYEKGKFPDGPPVIVGGDGDGTVNLRSLVGCLAWQGKQKHKVYHKMFPGVDHMGILIHPTILDYIRTLVTS